MEKVSIVIPTLKPELALKCIDSIVKTATLDRFQIIVVVSGVSGDVVNLFPDFVQVFVFKKRVLPAAAYNIGIKVAKYDYVLLLNDDIEFLEYGVQDYWVDLMISKLKENDRVGAVGVTWLHSSFGIYDMDFLSQEDRDYGFLVFYCVMFKVEVFRNVGLLDERFVCGVDVDYCLRMRRKGYLLSSVETKPLEVKDSYLVGDFPIYHAGEKTVHDVFTQKQWKDIMYKDLMLLRDLYGKRTGVIIPAWSDCRKDLVKCLDSLIKYTDMSKVDVVVVANGCVPEVRELLDSYGSYIRYFWFDEALGATAAINYGIRQVDSDIVVILNQDVVFLGSGWLEMLLKPFQDDLVGIVGPLKTFSYEEIRFESMMFFCVAIRRKLFEDIGLLDEAFSPGGFEDIDFCMRAKKAGWKMVQVPNENLSYDNEQKVFCGYFPIFHKENHVNWLNSDLYDRNYRYLVNKHLDCVPVTAYILTKDRYFTTLPLALFGIISQTFKVKELLIIDDNDKPQYLLDNVLYRYIFNILEMLGIEWKVLEGKHYVAKNHRLALENAKYDLLWRVDDDNFAMYDVLESCLRVMYSQDKVGAVGTVSLVCDSKNLINPNDVSGLLKDIWNRPIPQWAIFNGIKEVEHLHNTFVYRRKAVQNVEELMQLSPVGHREETMFSGAMYRAGWRLFVIGQVVTWHLRMPFGGIRQYNEKSLWDNDELIFEKWLNKEKGLNENIKLIVLDSGIGDHIEFLKVLDLVKKKYKDYELVLATCYPEVFEGQGIRQISIAEARELLSEEEYLSHNVYKFMLEKNWNKSIKDAYIEMYGLKEVM